MRRDRTPGARESLRQSQRENGTLDAGQYGRALLAYFAKKQRERQPQPPFLRDQHGAFTVIGRAPLGNGRRMWLGGISAQRGY